MTVIALTYLGLLYLIFFRFRLLPWNKATQMISLFFGVIFLSAFMVLYENLTPGSSQAVVMGRVVDIAPQVGGVVLEVPVKENERIEAGDVLFEIDPTLFDARVKDLEATIALAKLRLGQFGRLAEVDAASQFQVEETEALIEQLEARLQGARFDLANCTVRAPFTGRVPKLLLKPGVQVSPARAVLTFVDTKQLSIFAIFPQKALQNVKLGDPVTVNFPAMPGRVFDTEVREFVSGIEEGQILATGRLDPVQRRRMVRGYPLWIDLPEDFPQELRKVGIAAGATIHTESSGPISIYALFIQWAKSSLDAVL